MKYFDGVTSPKVITAHFDIEIFNCHLFTHCENKFKLFCKRNLSLSDAYEKYIFVSLTNK